MEKPTKLPNKSDKRDYIFRIIIAIIGFSVYLLFVPALLFLAAGTLRWPMAWVYTALLLLSTVGSRLVVLFKHPDLLGWIIAGVGRRASPRSCSSLPSQRSRSAMA
jgi:hypothetical protein